MKLFPVVLIVPLLSHFVISDVIDYPWITVKTASRNYGYALAGHVIKTLSLFLPDCIAACQEKLICFSINYADYKNGTFVCELNRSSKKRHENSYQPRKQYEYIEIEDCDESGCHTREGLSDGWFAFKGAQFKLFFNKLSWDAAKSHCQSLGAANNFLLSNNLDQYSLYGDAHKTVHEGRTSLDFDGNGDYALITGRDIRTTSFTIAFWLYPRTYTDSFNFIGDNIMNNKHHDNAQFSIYTYMYSMHIRFVNVYRKDLATVKLPKSEVPKNVWTHVAITWNRADKVFNVYANAVLKVTEVSTLDNVDLHDTGLSEIEFAKSDGGKHFDGLMSDIAILPYTMSQSGIQSLKDGLLFGAWIGLNDKTQEGTFQWSDGTPLSYMPGGVVNTADNDCVYLRKEENSTLRWVPKSCSEIHPFICEKH